jgi:phosphoenolpyruvate synthase/pyruvate phosphate dikinase
VIVRTSDVKTNAYARLIGGAEFEPREEHAMLGCRGASRCYCRTVDEARRVLDTMRRHGLKHAVEGSPAKSHGLVIVPADRLLAIM